MPARDGRVANLVSVMAQSLLALASTGVVRPYRPDKLFRLAKTLAYWGTGPAGGYAALAVRMPVAIGIVDERGPLTFDEIHRRTNAVANALAELGVQEGDLVGLLVSLLDEDGRQVLDGEVGRVHVANSLPFEGYTGAPDAGADVTVDGPFSTGDLGRWRDGLLFVEGRDEMIVSGGENVYPTPGRGLPRHPPRRRRDGRGRCRRRRVRAAAERVRRLPVGSRAGRRGDRADVDQVAVVGLCGPAGRVLHRRAAAQRDREGGQAPPRSRRSVVTDERYKACSL